MYSFKKILVAVDDSPDSLQAFNYAAAYAKQNHSKLGIATIFEINRLNVYEYLTPEVIRENKQKILNVAENYRQQALNVGVKDIEVIVEEGSPANAILNQIMPVFEPDLLICGSKGKPNKSPLDLGSQAAALAKGATCSVMIVR